jgi:hypothetical protein
MIVCYQQLYYSTAFSLSAINRYISQLPHGCLLSVPALLLSFNMIACYQQLDYMAAL